MCRMCDDPAHVVAGKTKTADRLALGLDFGTESARALLVDLHGHEHASVVAPYVHGQITTHLPTTDVSLPPDFALQAPMDWIDAAARATHEAMKIANAAPSQVISVGVDFTSCTVLPCRADGTPLALDHDLRTHPHAWPKLWKHHGAKKETERINAVLREARAPLLSRYGGTIGLEWLFPKLLEIANGDRAVFRATELFLEAGDWFVWQLTGADPARLIRSTCQAGYKAMWSAAAAKEKNGGYPAAALLKKISPRLANVAGTLLRGEMRAPGARAGGLSPAMAERFGLSPGTPVATAIIDAHAGVIGAGVAVPDVLVLVLGTSACHMLMSRKEKKAPGVAGIVPDGILPGFVGYETGQAAVGDAFAWLARTVGRPIEELAAAAETLSPGAGGVAALDWLNGCRTPLMDGSLRGAFSGLTLRTTPEEMYRALVEATGFGLRWIVETFTKSGIPVKRAVATGGIAKKNPSLVKIYADILQKEIAIAGAAEGPALGAAILGVLAAGKEVSGFSSAAAAVQSMTAAHAPVIVKPDRRRARVYEELYLRYRRLAAAERPK